MSSVSSKENQEAALMNFASETTCDIFSLEQPTGRPSILRQSQADNINKAAPRAAKVCFQTPRRDPVTKRIMSPSRSIKPSIQEDRTDSLNAPCSTEQASLKEESAMPISIQSNNLTFSDDYTSVQNKGAYTLDLDNLDAVNPFQASNKMGNSPPKTSISTEMTGSSEMKAIDISPVLVCAPLSESKVPESTEAGLDETLPFIQSVENSLADCSDNISSAEGTVIINTENIPESEVVAEEFDLAEPNLKLPSLEAEPLSSAGYCFDLENHNSVNPFQTGGPKIPNSPVLGQASDVPEALASSQDVIKESEISDDPKSSQGISTVTDDTSSTELPRKPQVLLEFNFDDGAEVKCKPPPKRLGVKRPAGSKPIKMPDVLEKTFPKPKDMSSTKLEENEPLDVLLGKGSYTFELDKFDDPNFNPFGTKAKMCSSPPRGDHNVPVLNMDPEDDLKTNVPAQNELHEQCSSEVLSENVIKTEIDPPVDLQQTTFNGDVEMVSNPSQNQESQESEEFLMLESKADVQNQTCDLFVVPPSEEEFVSGALFTPVEDFGQIDYLEQFGSSNFKESALRKQSLYLKFDPLLKESPKKPATDAAGFCLPRPSLAFRMMEAAKSETKRKSQSDHAKLLGDLPPPRQPNNNTVPDPMVLDLLEPSIKHHLKTEDSIIEVLKYSQKDMDAALQKAKRQAEAHEQELKDRIEALTLEEHRMLFIISEFESTITQITDEHNQNEDLAKIELDRVLREKEQLSKDLNDLERSFSSVVKRLDRSKEANEGFKKNEETLKLYAQKCMDRLQEEEKRYRALKAHAEEKMDQANKAITEVRTKQAAEVATLQIQLKREQLKVQSLEKELEQKTKEVADVTELCDELLLKVQKHGF